MFRQLQDSYDRYRKQRRRQDLPIGSFRRPPTSTFGTITSSITSSFRSNNNSNGSFRTKDHTNIPPYNSRGIGTSMDGSASSIQTPWMIQKNWQRTEKPVRITYICIIVGILMIWYGVRFISYYNGSVNINCHSTACDLIIYPIGFQRKIQLHNIPRQQLINVQPVKTLLNGTFVTDQNIQLNEAYNKRNKYSKHQNPNYSKGASYKGPDSNGHYLSYAFVLQDKNNDDERRIGMIDVDNKSDSSGDGNSKNDDQTSSIPEVDLTPLFPFLQKVDEDQSSSNNAVRTPPKYRLIPKTFGARHSQRRVRSMILKIESYVKFKRQKLVIIETASPAWQGIVLIVLGVVTVMITCTLGQFTNDYYATPQQYRGPGMRNSTTGSQRREQLLQKHNPSPSAAIAKRKVTLQSVNQIATPSQYEVNTSTTSATTATPRPPSTSSYTTNAATNMRANPNVSYRKAVASAHARSRVTQ